MSELRRRVVLKLELGADSWEAVEDVLNQIIFRLHEREQTGDSSIKVVSGGYESGYILEADEDPRITHDSYFESVEAMLAARKRESSDVAETKPAAAVARQLHPGIAQ